MRRSISSGKSGRSVTTAWHRTRSPRRFGSCRRCSSPPAESSPAVRSVIVTGGSRGLGFGIVRRLVCEGYAAIAVARHMNDTLAAALEHAERTRPGSLRFLPFDFADLDGIPNFVKTVRKECGPVYGLV